MEPRISLITLGVVDLARSTAFYEGLGWPRKMNAAEGVTFFQLNGIGFSLYPRSDLDTDAGVPLQTSPPQGFTMAYNTRTRNEVEEVLARAVALGGVISRPAQDAVWGGYHGHFADLDGFIWEVAWNPAFAILDDGGVRLPD